MKKRFGKLRREITRVLKWIARNQSLFKLVLRIADIIYKLLERIEP